MVRAHVIAEAICAFHLASYVSSPVQDRGGLMLVAPPGTLKSTFLDVLDSYSNTVTYSNLNTSTLTRAQEDLVSGHIRSIILPDLHSIYAGDPRTSGRLEANLMQLAGEGSRGPSWQDSRHQHFLARATIFGAMTTRHYEKMSSRWEQSGFLRRFLWARFTLENADILMDALEEWKRADIGGVSAPRVPVGLHIDQRLKREERAEIRRWLKHQPRPHEIQFALLCRAVAALRWMYRHAKMRGDAFKTMQVFSECLGRDAARVRLR